MVSEWRWSASGEISCPCCGSSYQVMSARGERRRYRYARCEMCDAVMDEWIDVCERRHLRIGDPVVSLSNLPIFSGVPAIGLLAQAG